METVQLIFWIEKLIGALPVLLKVFAKIRSCSLPEEATVPPTQFHGKEEIPDRWARILPHSEEVEEDNKK
jgi:hypothetical protein